MVCVWFTRMCLLPMRAGNHVGGVHGGPGVQKDGAGALVRRRGGGWLTLGSLHWLYGDDTRRNALRRRLSASAHRLVGDFIGLAAFAGVEHHAGALGMRPLMRGCMCRAMQWLNQIEWTDKLDKILNHMIAASCSTVCYMGEMPPIRTQ